jgi:hypothetical protein
MAGSLQPETADQGATPSARQNKRSKEEVLAIFRAAREAVRAANPTGRDLLAEFLAERRAAAANE